MRALPNVRGRDVLAALGSILLTYIVIALASTLVFAFGGSADDLLRFMPIFLFIAMVSGTTVMVAYARRRNIALGFRPLGRRGWHLLWQAPLVIVAAGGLASVIGEIAGIGPGEDTSAVTTTSVKAYLPIVLAAYLLLAPLLEEVVFRRFLMSYLDTLMPAAASVVLSSLLFGLMHVSPPAIIYTTLIGIGCAVVTRWHGSVWAGFVIHMCNNILVELIVVAGL